MSVAKTARWLDLLAYLLHHRFPVSRAQIFGHVAGYRDQDEESARRKFERDKAELKELGIVIESTVVKDADPPEGYRLRAAQVYLPYVELAEEPAADRPYRDLPRLPLSRSELAILDRATRRLAEQGQEDWAELARSLRRKLEFDLPLESLGIGAVLGTPLDDASQRRLAALQGVVAAGRAVRCRRLRFGAAESEWLVLEPFGLLFQLGRWHCAGRVRGESLTVIPLEELGDIEPLDGPDAGFVVPEGFAVGDLVGQAPWEWGTEPAAAVWIRLEEPDARWAMNRKLGRVAMDRSDDRGVTFEMTVRDRPAFLRWALSLGARARVTAPASVARELEELRARVAALYATGVSR